MENRAHSWDAYARLQAELARRPRVDDYSWGLEGGLDRLLLSASDQPNEEEVDRAVRSENRRTRHRARLRRVYLVRDLGVFDPTGALTARHDLQAVEAQVEDDDWTLLREIGEGRAYGEIAADWGVSEGQLRVRVLRLRRELAKRLDLPTSDRAAA